MEVLKANIKLVNEKLHFEAKTRENEILSVDYVPPLGDNLGYTSLELFLISLATCLSSSVLSLLRKMQKEIKLCEVEVDGLRKTEHPTCFENININFKIKSSNLDDESMKKALSLSESTYCPVYAMIKDIVKINVVYKIN